jgi:carotenoid cleavage dioxygenase
MHRWRIAPGASEASEDQRDERAIEFPRIDERLNGLPYRYAYAPMGENEGLAAAEENFTSLARYDMKTGTRSVRAFAKTSLMSEFVHTPKRADSPEDEGWLMGFVYDGTRGVSDFLILDAATLETQACIKLPRRVPQGFHGSWISGA